MSIQFTSTSTVKSSLMSLSHLPASSHNSLKFQLTHFFSFESRQQNNRKFIAFLLCMPLMLRRRRG
ncbi:CLUMA_CG009732, isoform A [Clunio marinus]|uniref:CLUMA_CG009732, isoform A n=1 Tax=Clunio marinus TaxID=568069 RepID=A0A1J1ICZ2_9DIPT|nr:CLUMA_CG009732, isoform A [Clunio marinus]